MLYVIFNPDGSIKTLVVGESIQQGDHETKQIFTKIEGIDPAEYTCSADFVLPDGELSYLVASQVTDESDEDYGEGYAITLTEGQTYLAGNLKMNLRLVDLQGHVLCTYQVTLKINPTAYDPNETNITEAQYNSLLQSLRSFVTEAWCDENLPQKNAVLNILTDLDIDGDTNLVELNAALQEKIGISQCITYLEDEGGNRHLCYVRVYRSGMNWRLLAIELNGQGYYYFSGSGITTIAGALIGTYHTFIDDKSDQEITGLKTFNAPVDQDGARIYFQNDDEGAAISIYDKDGNGDPCEHGYHLKLDESGSPADEVTHCLPAKSGTFALLSDLAHNALNYVNESFDNTDNISQIWDAIQAIGGENNVVLTILDGSYYLIRMAYSPITQKYAISGFCLDTQFHFYYTSQVGAVTVQDLIDGEMEYLNKGEATKLYLHSIDFTYSSQMEALTFISNSPTKLADLQNGEKIRVVGFGELTHFAASINPIDAIVTNSYINRTSNSFDIIYRSWSNMGTESTITVSISNISGTETVTEL